ncbi:MurR/RpiR family transcriptional regulator [Microlunatus endophyticus]|uniref:MurR/RpiR family transcriptional regulator n=1 Tax=Microlunatus endophyticus TaxID=1716077 RepID=UPI001E522C58|nr:MurR/RpiR family transcriptional regulator [Microlunatus endophyticus]
MAFDDLSPNDSMEVLSEKLIALHINALQQTVQSIDPDSLNSVVELLRGARHRMIFATAASSTPAEDLALKLAILGLPTVVLDDAHKAVLTLRGFDSRDVVVGMTYTGTIRAVGVVLNEARRLGVPTVGVTHDLGSYVGRSVDYVLRPMGRELSQLTVGLSTRTAQLVLGDLIFLSIAHANPDLAGLAAQGIPGRASSTYLRVDSGRG